MIGIEKSYKKALQSNAMQIWAKRNLRCDHVTKDGNKTF